MVTVMAGKSAGEIVMFSVQLVSKNELAVIVDLFPFYISMGD